jgi:hypothetical protein
VPYELAHGEPFPDVGIVVPFGCAALILLEKEDRAKFQSTCAMVIFVHYAQDHPLYTYAFFSPRTKRILFRQDCIFLPEIFPMREARAKGGLMTDGENLMVYRPRRGTVNKILEPAIKVVPVNEEEKFAAWNDNDLIPSYLDDITDFDLSSPSDDTMHEVEKKPEDWPSYFPSHPSFGPPSVVTVPKPWGASVIHENVEHEKGIRNEVIEEERRIERPRRSKAEPAQNNTNKRRPVKDRWFYETVQPEESTDIHGMPNEKEALITRTAVVNVFLEDLPGIGSDQVRVPNLGHAGPMECIPGYIEHAADTEETAWDIQGMVFDDKEIGWCEVTGWGVDHGVKMIYYSPLSVADPEFVGKHEHHVSLAEILSIIRGVPIPTRISDYKPSRGLKLPNNWNKQNQIMRLLSTKRKFPIYGTTQAQRVRALEEKGEVKTLSPKIIIRILKAQESMFKYGTFIPKSDREAEQSPEAPRWRSGWTLEWLRLRQANTFETDWTWECIRREHPEYKKEDIGHMFYVYDYKYSVEHRVRLVFDGSRQSSTTYSITYAPTFRAESVRMFICMQSNMVGTFSSTMFPKLSCDPMQILRYLFTPLKDSLISLVNC